MVLIGQVVFATVASFRGWGFRPFGLFLMLVLVGFLMGSVGVYDVLFYLVLDWFFLGVLGFMAFVPNRVVDDE
jgi:uncharacterized membrane protein